MAITLDGKQIRTEIERKLKAAVGGFAARPALMIIQVGERADSTVYIQQKMKCAEAIGAAVEYRRFSEAAAEADIVSAIKLANADPSVNGLIVQIPLPEHLDRERIIEAIAPQKDVDGLTSFNMKRLADGRPGMMPATTRGILALLDHYSIPIAGKRVTVVGRSALVGRPTALAFLNRDATVTVAHSKTLDLPAATRSADILIAAAGRPGLIGKDHVRPGQVVIDVGITSAEQGGARRLLGDVDRAAAEIVGWLSPVPGGVGPMTVVSLFENLIEAFREQNNNT